jgi:hypothetical protein
MHLAWYRVGQWLPWMKMGERPGSLIFSTYGWRIKNLDDLPDILKRMLERPEYALYREPPPADDTRPMADEYAYFQRIMQADGQSGAERP